uniref:BLTX711 n=1 Tax=Nephila pilipes TaxID=299642 RepID=A0A076L0B3_NEPPI|nr:BLTX711 [Nephila pilipes]
MGEAPTSVIFIFKTIQRSMMKFVVLLVLVVLAAPALAQDFQEFLQMFTDLGCTETDNIYTSMNRNIKMCDQCLSFTMSLEKTNPLLCGIRP